VKYRIVIRHQAEKELGRLGHDEQKRIGRKLLQLEGEPLPAGVKALQGRQGYRIRIGDYRVLYDLDEASKTVIVTSMAIDGTSIVDPIN
jgi:mRNA interferase RelE/StbE